MYGLGQEHRKKGRIAFLCSNTDFIGINETPGLRLWSKPGQLPQLKSHLSQCRQSQHNYLQFFQTTAKTNGNKIEFLFFMLYSLKIKVLCKVTLFHKSGLFSSGHHLHTVFQSVSESSHSVKCVGIKPMPVFSNISNFLKEKIG